MNIIITRVLPLSVDVRKLPLANIPIIAEIFGAGRVLRNYQAPPPQALQMCPMKPGGSLPNLT